MTVKDPSIKLNQTEATLAVNETVKLTATTAPKSAASSVTYTTSDEKVATVANDGTVTAVAAGEATITATEKCGTKTVTATAKITVKKVVLKEAKQTKAKEIELTIAGDATDIKVPDVKITNTATHATAAIESIKAKKNFPNVYTVATYTEMTDAKEYTVEYDKQVVKFTATDGAVAKVGLSRVEVPAGKLTPVSLVTLDKSDVELKTVRLTSTASGKGDISSEIKQTKGYTQDTSIYLPAVGDTAEVKVIYHSGSYGTDGKETGNIEGTFTVKAVDPTLENLNFDVTIGNSPAWKATSFKKNDKIKMGDEKNAYIRITDDEGKDVAVADYTNYKVETSDRAKLLVQEKQLVNSTDPIPVQGVSEGTAYILVKTNDDKTVASLPVNVQGKPVATTLDLSRTSVTVVEGASEPEIIRLTLKDQYGDSMNIDKIDVNLLSAAKDSIKTTSDFSSAGDETAKTVTVAGTDFDKDGAYTFKITAKNGDKSVDRTLGINRVKDGTVTDYVVKADNEEVDTTIGANTTATSIPDITLNVAARVNGGVKELYTLDDVYYTVKDPSGKVIGEVKDDHGTAVMATTGAAIANNAYNANSTRELKVQAVTNDPESKGSNYFHKNLKAGTYTVVAKFKVGSKDTTAYGSFTIKDSQEGTASCTILDNKFAGQTVAAAFETGTLVDVYFDGLKQIFSSGDVISVDGTYLPSGNGGAFVKSVELYVKVSGDGVTNRFNITVQVESSQGTVAECTGLK